jgi:hypothetical protein
MNSRVRLIALLAALSLGWGRTAKAQVPACDVRGIAPMRVPCEIRTSYESPPKPSLITSGLLALGVPLTGSAAVATAWARSGDAFLYAPPRVGPSEPVVGVPAPSRQPQREE